MCSAAKEGKLFNFVKSPFAEETASAGTNTCQQIRQLYRTFNCTNEHISIIYIYFLVLLCMEKNFLVSHFSKLSVLNLY